MQKEKTTQARRAKAGKAGNTGSTGHTRTAGKAGKTSRSKLTEAQRIAKRARDRRYREQARMAREMAETLRPGAGAGSSCAGPAPCIEPPRAASVQDVFGLIGRFVVTELAKEGMPRQLRPSTSPEPGVTCQQISLPDGRTATLTVVDVDVVDPLSERSTIPAPIRMHLLRQRMAREISDIVDSHVELP